MSKVEVVPVGPVAAPARGSAERVTPQYGAEPLLRRMLAGADVLSIVVAATVVAVWGSSVARALLLVLSVPIWIVTAKLVGLYDRDQRSLRHLTVDELSWLVLWVLGSTVVLTTLLQLSPALNLSTNDRLYVRVTVLTLAFAFRAAARAIWRRITPPERVLVVGDGPLAAAFVRKLDLFPDMHAEVAFEVENSSLLVSYLDGLTGKLDRIVVACSDFSEELLEKLLPFCRLNGLKLTVVPPTRGMFGTATHLGHIADLPLLDYNTWDISRSTIALKRAFDVIVSALALILTFPILLLASLAVLLDSGFPIFFRQERAGQNGAPFVVLKFRTMVRDAEARLAELVPFDELADPMFKLRSDPRITRVGRLLRRTSIDELPQLVNVLLGDMSIVGPRPEQADLVERYRPEHRFRLALKPGITGPMQVYGRGELSFEERLAVEREYVENLSLARDMRIVLMTLPAVFTRRGAY